MLRHVVLDEVQDLVGDRAELARALLQVVGPECGFTALGDPMQGIYDWQLENSAAGTTNQEFLCALENELGAHRTFLATDYRARGPEPREVVQLGGRLASAETDALARQELDEVDAQSPEHRPDVEKRRPGTWKQ